MKKLKRMPKESTVTWRLSQPGTLLGYIGKAEGLQWSLLRGIHLRNSTCIAKTEMKAPPKAQLLREIVISENQHCMQDTFRIGSFPK